MKVLSLFDGISCARVALERAGISVELYRAIEIDKYATKISQKNYPDIVRTSDVRDFIGEKGSFELIIGGSPCQDLSIAKKDRKGLDGERSGLFWEYVRILNEVKPKYFILENVNSMSRESKDTITKALGVEPVMIDAALVSAQKRKRLFWVGKLNGEKYEQVHIPQPEDRGILLKDILEDGVDEKYNISEKLKITFSKPSGKNGTFLPMKPRKKNDKAVTLLARYYKNNNYIKRIGKIGKGGQGDRVYSIKAKSVNLSALGGGRGAKTGLYAIKDYIRKLTPIECERLQSLDDNFTDGVSNTQRYKMLGNAFNVDVITHIMTFLDKQ